MMTAQQTEFDCDWTDTPRCPYCGYYEQDWWEDSALHDDGGSTDEFWCASCDKSYAVIAHHDVHFGSKKRKETDAETKETP